MFLQDAALKGRRFMLTECSLRRTARSVGFLQLHSRASARKLSRSERDEPAVWRPERREHPQRFCAC
jgi:hypothetical protein